MTTARAEPRRLYFAYGSNLDAAQMAARCPEATVVAPATLTGYTLVFAGYSVRWGGAVATVVACPALSVPGVVYAVTRADLARLDGYEGAPGYYRRTRVEVEVAGQRRSAVTYALLARWFRLGQPSVAYFAQIAAGYRAFDLPTAALSTALGTTAAADAKRGRARNSR